jgi:hypothetical protein
VQLTDVDLGGSLANGGFDGWGTGARRRTERVALVKGVWTIASATAPAEPIHETKDADSHSRCSLRRFFARRHHSSDSTLGVV